MTLLYRRHDKSLSSGSVPHSVLQLSNWKFDVKEKDSKMRKIRRLVFSQHLTGRRIKKNFFI